MSEKIRILEELSVQHPEYAEKLNEIISTLQNPLSAYCEEEAAYRFDELTSLKLDKESIYNACIRFLDVSSTRRAAL